MKIPSLTRIPNYKRFNITPRYYDPVKEDIEQRTERIKIEMQHERSAGHKTDFKGAFSRNEGKDRQANIIQASLIVLMVGLFVGYYFYGNNVFYIFLILFPAYIFYRWKAYSRHK